MILTNKPREKAEFLRQQLFELYKYIARHKRVEEANRAAVIDYWRNNDRRKGV